MEVRGIVVGAFLCLLSLAFFIYGIVTMTSANAASSALIIVVGVFLGIAGFLVLAANFFSGGFFSI